MKIILCILIVSFATIQKVVFAHGHGHPHFNTLMCCNVDKPAPGGGPNEKVKASGRECAHELGYDTEEGKKEHGRDKMICMTECVSKKNNLIDANNNINEAVYTNAVKEMAQVDHQKAVADDIAKKCIGEAQSSNNDEGNNKCNPTAAKVMKCVFFELFKSCPADKQDTSENCVKLREDINSGKFKRGPKPESGEN